MSEDVQKNNEIDFIDILRIFFNWIKKLFVWIFNTILFIFRYVIRKLPILLIFTIVGMGIGAGMYYMSPRSYESSMVLRTNNTDSYQNKGEIDRLNQLLQLGHYDVVAQLLNIPDSTAKKIISIKALYGYINERAYASMPYEYGNKPIFRDSNYYTSPQFLKIEANVLDEDIYSQIQGGIVHYLSNNEYNLRSNKVREREVNKQIKLLEGEVEANKRLQELTIVHDRTRVSPTEDIAANSKGEIIAQLQKNVMGMYKDAIGLERTMDLYLEPVTVIYDFPKTYTHAIRLGKNYMIPFGVAFFLLGLVILFIKDYRKQIVKFIYGN